jgi:hypothetical protein
MSLEFIVCKGSGELMYSYPPADNSSSSNKLIMDVGLLTALNMFAKSSMGKDISSMMIGGTTYVMKNSDSKNVSYTLRGKMKEKEMKKTLEDASKEFEKKYSGKIDSWNGDITLFDDFNNYFSNVVKNFSKSFW